jgi:hypothetical protein
MKVPLRLRHGRFKIGCRQWISELHMVPRPLVIVESELWPYATARPQLTFDDQATATLRWAYRNGEVPLQC